MKLLILGSFGPGALEHYYLNGLRDLGVDIQTFDLSKEYESKLKKSLANKVLNKIKPEFFFNPINQNLIRILEGKMFDVILVFKGMALFPSTVIALKNFTRLLCCYNPDHPFNYYSPGSGNKNILESIRHYDVYISYAAKIVEKLKILYGVQSFVLPFGYDEDLKPVPSSLNYLNGQFAFIGAYDEDRKKLMKSLKTPRLSIFGDDKWQTRTLPFSKLRAHVKGSSLFGQNYINAIASADGVFNILRRQNLVEESHNMRTFEVPGYGGLLISNRTEEQQQFFEENREAIYFDSIDELNDKVTFLEKNHDFIDTLKKNALCRCRRSNYSYRSRSADLLKKLEGIIA